MDERRTVAERAHGQAELEAVREQRAAAAGGLALGQLMAGAGLGALVRAAAWACRACLGMHIGAMWGLYRGYIGAI